jgi:hypothetical protein
VALSRRKLAPLGQVGQSVLLEDITAIEVMVVVEVIADRGMGGGKLLQGLYVPELRHYSFSSSEWLVGIFGWIVMSLTALLIGNVAYYLHC